MTNKEAFELGRAAGEEIAGLKAENGKFIKVVAGLYRSRNLPADALKWRSEARKLLQGRWPGAKSDD